jgi:hypothetical protein
MIPITLIVGNPENQIAKSGFYSTSDANEGDTLGMADDDLFIKYVE